MRVLQINSHYDQGGAARVAACLHRELLKEGVDSYVAYGRGEKAREGHVLRFETGPEIYASALLSRLTGINGWWNRLATERLLGRIRSWEPDVVHLHNLHGYYLNLPMLFHCLDERKIPCVWTLHDCYAFVGGCGFFFECRRWQEGCGHCPHLRDYPASQWFDFTHWMWKRKRELFTGPAPKVIVTPSQWLTGEAEKSFLGQYDCLTVRNGVDTENVFYPRDRRICRDRHGYGQQEKLILGIAAGYRDERKGARYIIQLAKDLEGEARVVLIGWDKENDGMLEGTRNVVTLPRTSDTELLAEYYSMADVFVIPSLAENYATTTLEAMACGTPAVGFASGGIPEQLTEGRGIAVPPRDQQAFDRAVRRAMDPGGGLLRGEALAEKIRQENSVRVMTRAYRDVYERLLEARGGREEL